MSEPLSKLEEIRAKELQDLRAEYQEFLKDNPIKESFAPWVAVLFIQDLNRLPQSIVVLRFLQELEEKDSCD